MNHAGTALRHVSLQGDALPVSLHQGVEIDVCLPQGCEVAIGDGEGSPFTRSAVHLSHLPHHSAARWNHQAVKHVDILGHLSLNGNTGMLDGNFLGQNDMKRRSHRDGQGKSVRSCGPILSEPNPNAATENGQACREHVHAPRCYHVMTSTVWSFSARAHRMLSGKAKSDKRENAGSGGCYLLNILSRISGQNSLSRLKNVSSPTMTPHRLRFADIVRSSRG